MASEHKRMERRKEGKSKQQGKRTQSFHVIVQQKIGKMPTLPEMVDELDIQGNTDSNWSLNKLARMNQNHPSKPNSACL